MYDATKITFPYPPFVDGTYKQVSELIDHIGFQKKLNDAVIEFLKHNLSTLEDKEKNPIKYIKKWVRNKASNYKGELLFTIPFLENMKDTEQLTDEELENLKNKIRSIFIEEGFQDEEIPYPLTAEKILYEKKNIINQLYYEAEKNNYRDRIITNDIPIPREIKNEISY